MELSSGQWLERNAGTSLHDRARDYTDWLWRVGIHHGGVGNAFFKKPGKYDDVWRVHGLVDSAIWTGTYLAAEALRLKATGASDARNHVIQLTHTLHRFFEVTGQPGLLARYVAPSARPAEPELTYLDCEKREIHCNQDFDGEIVDFAGHVSRDQYQGVILGYALAYEALGQEDEDTRAMIRADVVEFVEELMKLRTVPARIDFDGAVFNQDLEMRFVVLAPHEFTDGRIELTVDSSDEDASEAWGFQEFIPNLADVLHQVPLLSVLPDVPRASSAIMLASFFQVALAMTEDVPEYASRHQAIFDFYVGNSDWGGSIADWLDVAELWVYRDNCGDGYYANNILMEPMYNLARLETDPERSKIVVEDLLESRVWKAFAHTKNPFFSFIYASARLGTDVDDVVDGAVSQLAQYPPAPRVRISSDLRDQPQYSSREEGCNNQLSHDEAVDVGERAVWDFLWQRNPWELVWQGDERQLYPGIDYLVAYWMGRHHGFLDEDRTGICAVWRSSE